MQSSRLDLKPLRAAAWPDRFSFFGKKIADGRVAITHRGPRDVARWSMVASVEVVGAARADAPAHLDAPRGVLRRPGEHVEGNLRKLMQVGAAAACASRGDAASRPARRSRLLPGFRRQTRPPVPKPSVAAKPSPADSCRAPP